MGGPFGEGGSGLALTAPTGRWPKRPRARPFPIQGTVHNLLPSWTPNLLINKNFVPRVHESGTPPSENFFFRPWLGAPAEVPEGRRGTGVFSDLLISMHYTIFVLG